MGSDPELGVTVQEREGPMAKPAENIEPKPMRWDAQKDAVERDVITGVAVLKLSGVTRTVRTPEFAGIVFHEVESKSALTKVPETSRMPFRWTINPYRGCTMGQPLLFCPQDPRIPGAQ